MLNISELLDDTDFIETVTFDHGTHSNTNVQPASSTTLQKLDVGERSKDTLQVFTKSNFPLQNGDYMTYNDKRYRCIASEDWSKQGYYDALFQLYNGAQDNTDDGEFNPWA